MVAYSYGKRNADAAGRWYGSDQDLVLGGSIVGHIRPLALGAVFAALAGSMPVAAGADLPPPPPHNWYQQPGYLPGRVRVDSPVAPKDVPFFQQHRIPCVVNGVPVAADIGSGVIGDNSTLYGVIFKSDGTGCTLSTLVRVTGTHSTAEPLVEAVAKASPVVGELLKAAGGIGPNPRSVEEIMVRSGVFAGPDHTIHIDQPYVFYLLLAKRQAGLQPQDPLLVVNPQSARNASAVPLTGDWWTRTDLLPQTLASPLRVTGAGRAGTFKLSTGAEIPGGSIVMAETTRAYFLDTKGALRPLVTLPDTAPGITLSGGRFPVPVGGGLEVTPASTGPTPTQYASVAALLTGISLVWPATAGGAGAAALVAATPQGWFLIGAGTVVLIGSVAVEIWQKKQASGLTDQQIGRRVSPSGQVGSPLGPDDVPPEGNQTPPDDRNPFPEAQKKVPERFGTGQPADKGIGWKWSDGTGGYQVRVMRANPSSANASQRVDYVQVRYNGKVIGQGGQVVKGARPGDEPVAHIPYAEWAQWSSWFAP